MAKKTKSSQEEKRPKTTFSLIFLGLGIIQLLIGGFMMWTSSGANPSGPTWLRTAAMVVLVLGGVAVYLSTLPKEQAIEWIKSGLFALTLALLIRWPIGEPYRIPSGSMEPTLKGDPRIARGDRVFVNKWIYGVRYPFMNKRIWQGQDPQRWDIVVFKSVEENAVHKTLVKRVVGLPGERIEIKATAEDIQKARMEGRRALFGTLYVNGEEIEIPEFMPGVEGYTVASHPGMLYGVDEQDEYAVVPEGHYLVLGDNSANSRDGRYFGWLPNENIVGRVASVWWPPTSWRDFTGFSATWWWKTLLTMIGILFFVRLLVGRSWVVQRPGTKKLDHLFIYFLSYGLRLPFTPFWLLRWAHPKRGDMVLYHPVSKEAPAGAVLIGRVAALGGEKVSIQKGVLQINNQPLEEPESLCNIALDKENKAFSYGCKRNAEYQSVPEKHLFLLDPDQGDEDALDSRILGWVPESNVHGKVGALWWPPSRWRKIQ